MNNCNLLKFIRNPWFNTIVSELIKRAEDWFEVAKYALREGRFWLTCYASHQAVELYANDVLFMGLVHTHSLII